MQCVSLKVESEFRCKYSNINGDIFGYSQKTFFFSMRYDNDPFISKNDFNLLPNKLP